jgi:hypothetical protein
VVASGFYDDGPLRHVAINLFYGWGYNFYRLENQLRADDQLVRTKASWLLGLAVTAVSTAETAYRRAAIPTPTRAQPYPDPAAVANAQAIEQLSRSIGALVGRINAQPVPENDRITQRHRQEANTLAALADRDQTLVGQCDLMRSLVEARDGAWIVENLGHLETGVAAIEATLRERASLLQ